MEPVEQLVEELQLAAERFGHLATESSEPSESKRYLGLQRESLREAARLQSIGSRQEGGTASKTVASGVGGALIGSLVFPGVGTLVGGALGSYLGAMAGENPVPDDVNARRLIEESREELLVWQRVNSVAESDNVR